MTQKYPDGNVVYSPGTVIISAVGEVEDVKKIVSPVLQNESDTILLYIDFSSDTLKLGGSAYAQINNSLGKETPCIKDSAYFIKAFNTVQYLNKHKKILAGHDVSTGGMITTCWNVFCFPRCEFACRCEHYARQTTHKDSFCRESCRDYSNKKRR